MASYKVEEISKREQLDGIAECIWATMEHDDSEHKVFFPILTDRETALNESKERLWKEHTKNPSSHWLFVRDVSSKSLKVLGGCQWRLCEHNSFPNGLPKIVAT